MKRLILLLLFSFVYLNASIENSVIPNIGKFEILENLPITKFSTHQYEEIAEVLKQKDQMLRVATYNVLFNRYDHDLDEVNRWPQRLPRIVELIEEMQPDILGVQELYQEQLEGLLPHFSHAYEFYSTPCADGELNGIFYRRDRFEVIESKVLYMSETPDVPSSDTLTMIQFKDLHTGQIFTIANTHLTFSKINKRDFQVRFIADEVALAAEDCPLIFMGDLNTFPLRLEMSGLPALDGDYLHRLLTKQHLKDARELALLGHFGPLATFTNAPDKTIPFQGEGTPGVFLDHIYVTRGIQVVIHAVQPAKVNGHFPSDHMPLLIDCLIK